VSLNTSKTQEISSGNKAGRGLSGAYEKVGILRGLVGEDEEFRFPKQFCEDMWSYIQNLNAGELFLAGEYFLRL
jgi:hypothetical protein